MDEVCDTGGARPAGVDYYRFVQGVAAASAISSDVTPLDAARDTDLGDFADLTDTERIVGNLHRAMFEGSTAGSPAGR